tara:strand:- start:475 stop:954 length:480 start_codon:yes stop_codon:yes gene_type:complete
MISDELVAITEEQAKTLESFGVKPEICYAVPRALVSLLSAVDADHKPEQLELLGGTPKKRKKARKEIARAMSISPNATNIQLHMNTHTVGYKTADVLYRTLFTDMVYTRPQLYKHLETYRISRKDAGWTISSLLTNGFLISRDASLIGAVKFQPSKKEQ